nr:hypothetical protein [Tanacetum cinerariifolium]
MIGSSSRIQLTDTILEVPIPQPQTQLTGLVIDILYLDNLKVHQLLLKLTEGVKELKKIQDAKIKVLNKEHSKKSRKATKLKKKRIDQYMWTTTSRLKA